MTTLAPGSQATATITGTDEEPVLNLGIPKGDPGDVSSTGYYPDLYAGGLVTDKGETDVSPYTFRASKALGYRESLNQIVGATVGWNQLLDGTRTSLTINGITFTVGTDGIVTMNGTATGTARYDLGTRVDYKKGHKYAVIGVPQGGSASTYRAIITDYNYTDTIDAFSADDYYLPRVEVYEGTTVNNVKFSPRLHDLTQMFGSTIADYIYSLEQATAGAGVAWFRRYFPEDYYPYSANTLQSVQATAHKTYDSDGNVLGNYALDSSLTLRGIPKLDASNNLYYDGDEYESDGTVTRKYGIVDLGTLTWGFIEPVGSFTYGYFYANVSGKADGLLNFITVKYPVFTKLFLP